MVKKDFLLGKDSKHPYSGESVYFATQHLKEKVIAPLFKKIEMSCLPLRIDTDHFGTFSGEIERNQSTRETLKLKINAAVQACPEGRFFLASEGNFGPHPVIGLIPSDHEALLFVDRKHQIEIYAEELSAETNHCELEISPGDNYHSFLSQIDFPKHGVIVKSKESQKAIFKNLKNESDVDQAIKQAFQLSSLSKIILSTDMRACFNPTRMRVIEKAGQNLIEKLISLCPNCHIPGYSIIDGIPGLTCEDCGLPSQISKAVLWTCNNCHHSEIKNRPDNLMKLPASHCENCNP